MAEEILKRVKCILKLNTLDNERDKSKMENNLLWDKMCI